MTKQVSDASFKADVLDAAAPVVVDFWAPWCGPCRMVAPIVDQLADEYQGRVEFVKLNVDDNPETSVKYNVQSIPTLLVFRNGRLVGKLVGALPKRELQKHVDAVLT